MRLESSRGGDHALVCSRHVKKYQTTWVCVGEGRERGREREGGEREGGEREGGEREGGEREGGEGGQISREGGGGKRERGKGEGGEVGI